MYLSDLRAALRQHWGVAVAAMAFWILVGFAMATLPAQRYRSTATVAVTVSQDLIDPIQVASFQIPIIVERAESRNVVAAMRAGLDERAAAADVDVSVTSDQGTGIIRITTEGGDSKAIVAWANGLAKEIAAKPDSSGLVLQVIEDAIEPDGAFSPKVVPIVVGTVALGLLSAVLIVVIVSRVGKALDLEEEIQRRFGLPVLGRIPATHVLRWSDGQGDALTLNPELMEAFKNLRTNLELLLLDVSQPAMVSIVSWGEGEGKSTVTAGLALTTAVSGQDVLAVDADLRHPTLHARLGQPFGEGMAKATEREIERLVGPTDHPHLWLLPAGIPDRHPADLLALALGRVLDFARGHHRRVLIDCPPLHGVAETLMVLAAAQNVIIVVDGRKTRLPDLEAMTSRLQAAGVRVLGVVLNRVQRSKQTSTYPSFVLREEPKANGIRPSRDRLALPTRDRPIRPTRRL